MDQGGDLWDPLSNRSAQALCVLALVLTALGHLKDIQLLKLSNTKPVEGE